MLKVLLLSRYGRLGASSRLRSYQYIPFLESKGISVTVHALFDDNLLTAKYRDENHIKSTIYSYISRLFEIYRANNYDLIWVEYEMLPWIPNWFERVVFQAITPVVVDYDDAIFHRYDCHHSAFVRFMFGKKIDAVMRSSDLVIVGNDYLGDRAKNAKASRIELLPTVVDNTRYSIDNSSSNSPFTIGWIGSPSTGAYLNAIAPALRYMTKKHGARIVVVGASQKQFQDFPVDARSWSEETEVSEIQQFDVGIMPLPDDEWAQGKCGYKLIQYMACGLPVVASPVGVNTKIINHGVNGFLASSEKEWIEAFELLVKDKLLRQSMGKEGRSLVETNYSLQVTAPRLVNIMKSVVNESCVV